jgi:predicted MFS family arabinose efflux permease
VACVIVVTGHFAAYTYISEIVRRDAGFTGLALAAVLFGYGVAGVGGIPLAGWTVDRRPRLAAVTCAAVVTLAMAGLATVSRGSAVLTVAAAVLWGGAFTTIPVVFQAAVLRVAPRSADTASALMVVAFQIGIGGGALAGSVLVDCGRGADLAGLGALLALAATVLIAASRRAFPVRPALTEPLERAG